MFIASPPRTVLLTNISVYVLVRSVRETAPPMNAMPRERFSLRAASRGERCLSLSGTITRSPVE
jgi:hypothetical protein